MGMGIVLWRWVVAGTMWRWELSCGDGSLQELSSCPGLSQELVITRPSPSQSGQHPPPPKTGWDKPPSQQAPAHTAWDKPPTEPRKEDQLAAAQERLKKSLAGALGKVLPAGKTNRGEEDRRIPPFSDAWKRDTQRGEERLPPGELVARRARNQISNDQRFRAAFDLEGQRRDVEGQVPGTASPSSDAGAHSSSGRDAPALEDTGVRVPPSAIEAAAEKPKNGLGNMEAIFSEVEAAAKRARDEAAKRAREQAEIDSFFDVAGREVGERGGSGGGDSRDAAAERELPQSRVCWGDCLQRVV